MKQTLLAIALLSVLAAGCAPLIVGAAGAGAGVAYLRGSLNATFPATVAQVTEATDIALNRMMMTEVSVVGDATGAEVRARSATDDRIRIDIDPAGTGVTEISIRVGTFGDQAKSQMIYDEIRDTLIRRGHIQP
jgi:tartrate dehydratase alpha subunit/fumarate hydratase class I-like protein